MTRVGLGFEKRSTRSPLIETYPSKPKQVIKISSEHFRYSERHKATRYSISIQYM